MVDALENFIKPKTAVQVQLSDQDNNLTKPSLSKEVKTLAQLRSELTKEYNGKFYFANQSKQAVPENLEHLLEISSIKDDRGLINWVVERQLIFDLERLFQGFDQDIMAGDFTILLVGGTGQGKTSFLNLLRNLNTGLKGVKSRQELIELNKKEHENGIDKDMKSKTSKPHTYQNVRIGNHYINIIDTPGQADTRGMRFDKGHDELIKEEILKQNGINCIVVVQNGRENRFTNQAQYTVDSITAYLPKQIKENIIYVFTNCENAIHRIFETKVVNDFFGRKENDQIPFVNIDNPFVYGKRCQEFIDKNDLTEEVALAELQRLFKSAQQSMIEFTERLAKFQKVPTKQFTELFEKKNQVEFKISQTYDEIEKLKNTNEQYENLAKRKLENYQKVDHETKCLDEINRYYTKYTTVRVKHHNTVCNKCKNVCHDSCTLPFTQKGELLEWCWIATKGPLSDKNFCNRDCRECKCDVHTHTHSDYYWTKEEVETSLYLERAKLRDQGLTNIQQMEQLMKKKKEIIDKTDAEYRKNQQIIDQLLSELKELSLGVSYERHQLIRLEKLQIELDTDLRPESQEFNKALVAKIEVILTKVLMQKEKVKETVQPQEIAEVKKPTFYQKVKSQLGIK